MAEFVQYPEGPREWTPSSREVKVLFRKYPEGDVVAIFPELPADNLGWSCMTYQHVGQHGGGVCSGIVENTRPATRADYEALLRELGRIGYSRLRIVKRMTPQMLKARREAASSWR